MPERHLTKWKKTKKNPPSSNCPGKTTAHCEPHAERFPGVCLFVHNSRVDSPHPEGQIKHPRRLWMPRSSSAYLKVLSLRSHVMKPNTQWRLTRAFSLPFTALPCLAVCHNQSILSVMTWSWIIDSCRRLTAYVIVEPAKHQTAHWSDTVLQLKAEMLQRLVDLSCVRV